MQPQPRGLDDVLGLVTVPELMTLI